MSLTLQAYHFSKRRNSLKRPAAESASFEVLLKGGSSIIHPVFTLNSDDFRYNYVEWYGRYYWVRDARSVRDNLWEVSCDIDVLATYRSEILSTTAFVEYSSSNYNLYIPDPRTVMRNQNTATVSTANSGLVSSGGTYIVGTIGTETGTYGATNYYCLSQDSVSQLCASLLDNTSMMIELKEYFSSAFDCLISCMYLPLSLNTSGTTVKLGTYDTGVSAGKLVRDVVVNTSSISPDWLGDFRDGSPYTRMVLFLPCCGAVAIEPSEFFRSDIMINQAIDTHTGDICYTIYTPSGINPIATYAGNCGVSIPVSQYQQNTGKVINGVMSTANSFLKTLGEGISSIPAAVATAMSGGAVSGGGGNNLFNGIVDTIMSGAQTYMDAITLTPSMVGGFTSAAGQAVGVNYVLTTYHAILSEGITAKSSPGGLPCFQTLNLGGLSGYCKCSGASVGAAANDEVIDAINAYVNGGIYIA